MRTAGAADIVELYQERKTLADYLIIGIEENAEMKRAAKDEKLEKKKKLTAAGLEMRHRARNRKMRWPIRSRSVPIDADGEFEGGLQP